MRGCCNGSQAGLRCQCPQGRGGSTPLPRTRIQLKDFLPTKQWTFIAEAHCFSATPRASRA